MAADLCLPLITLYRAMQDGWEPPGEVDEGEYRRVRGIQDPRDPLTAFVGFGCSYAGKWFGGYARDHRGRNYAAGSKNQLVRAMAKCRDVGFIHSDYRQLDIPGGSVVYCDPPYKGTTGYDAVGAWDVEEFWEWCRAVCEHSHLLVSEYEAPDFLKVVAVYDRALDMRRGGLTPERRSDVLFGSLLPRIRRRGD